MVANYGTQHKCLIISFNDFRDMMNGIFDITPEDDCDSMGLLWSFDDRCHFRFKPNKWLYEQLNTPIITIEDMSEWLLVDNIVDIVADTIQYNEQDRAKVYIIYD